LSTTSGDVVRKRRVRTRRPIRPGTWVVIFVVLVIVFGAMALILSGWLPVNGGISEPPAGVVTPTSANAAFVTVEKAGDPVRDASGQVTVKVKITNKNLMQSPPVQGTPTPGVPTPMPVPAKIINATVKVIFFNALATNPSRQIVGSAVGNYFNPQGLADGQSATLDVVAIGVADFKDYQVSVDTVFTDDRAKCVSWPAYHAGCTRSLGIICARPR